MYLKYVSKRYEILKKFDNEERGKNIKKAKKTTAKNTNCGSEKYMSVLRYNVK